MRYIFPHWGWALAAGGGFEDIGAGPGDRGPGPHQRNATIFRFADFEFCTDPPQLRLRGEPVRVRPQPLQLLSVLLSRPGQVVTREELRRELWGDNVHVAYDDALNHRIKDLRVALGDDPAKPRYVETVPRIGYRFMAPVRKVEDAGPEKPQIHPPAAPPLTASHAHWTTWRSLAAVTAIALVVGLSLAGWLQASIPAGPQVTSVVQLTRFGLANAVLSDGTTLFIEQEKGGIYSLATCPASGCVSPNPLPLPFRNVRLQDISPDRTRLLLASFEKFGDRQLLWQWPLAGGPPRRVANVISGSAKWSPGGSRIAFCGNLGEGPDGLYLINSDGSSPRRMSDVCGEISAWSPDGQRLVLTRSSELLGGASLWEIRTDGSGLHPLLPGLQNPKARWGEGQCCAVWNPGQPLVFRNATVAAQSLWTFSEPRSVLPLGHSRPARLYAAGFDLIGSPSIPAQNRVYVVGRTIRTSLARLDSNTREFAPLLAGVPAHAATWSPDGQWICYSQAPDRSLWKAHPDGSGRVELLSPPALSFFTAWSPDGSRIAVHILQPGRPGKIALVPAAGGVPEILLADEQHTEEDDPSWSPDGAALMFQRFQLDDQGRSTAAGLWTMDMKTKNLSELPGSEHMDGAAWSPDGRYILARSDDLLRLMLYDVRAQSWRQVASGVYLGLPLWRRDSRAFYYQDTRGSEDQPIFLVAVAGGRHQEIANRAQIPSTDVAEFRLTTLTPNGQPVITIIRRNSDVYALDVRW